MKTLIEVMAGDVVTFEDNKGHVRCIVIELRESYYPMTGQHVPGTMQATLYGIDSDGQDYKLDTASDESSVLQIEDHYNESYNWGNK